MAGFTAWLEALLQTEKFKKLSAEYIDIHKRLKGEKDNETWRYLIERARQLEKEY